MLLLSLSCLIFNSAATVSLYHITCTHTHSTSDFHLNYTCIHKHTPETLSPTHTQPLTHTHAHAHLHTLSSTPHKLWVLCQVSPEAESVPRDGSLHQGIASLSVSVPRRRMSRRMSRRRGRGRKRPGSEQPHREQPLHAYTVVEHPHKGAPNNVTLC